jgi:hypothetical protein
VFLTAVLGIEKMFRHIRIELVETQRVDRRSPTTAVSPGTSRRCIPRVIPQKPDVGTGCCRTTRSSTVDIETMAILVRIRSRTTMGPALPTPRTLSLLLQRSIDA